MKLFWALLLIIPNIVQASEYQKALIRAQDKVARAHAQGAQALTTASIATLHRPYQVGDAWDVLSWNWSDLTPSAGRGTILHYEVTDVSPTSGTGTVPQQVQITMTQTLDPKVQSIQLTLQNLLYDSQRELRFQTRTVALSGDTMPGNLSPLESYPFEFPDLRSAEKTALSPTYTQQITPEALDAAKKVGFQLDTSRATRLESQDSFGRPIDVIWQRGDLWPTYANTAHGFMFLLKKE